MAKFKHADAASPCRHRSTTEVSQVATMHLRRCDDCRQYVPFGPAPARANDDRSVISSESTCTTILVHALSARHGYARCGLPLAVSQLPDGEPGWDLLSAQERAKVLEAQLAELEMIAKRMRDAISPAIASPCASCVRNTQLRIDKEKMRAERKASRNVNSRNLAKDRK